MPDKIRVLVVDDSALTREAIKSIFSSDTSIEIIGEAIDGREGVRKVFALKPDVITMDLKMPIMNGLDAIQAIMEERPTPIIVVSSMDVKVIVKALSVGAMDFVPISESIDEIAHDLLDKVKVASKVKALRRIKRKPVKKKAPTAKKKTISKVVAIGISTGGPQALEVLLSKLPADFGAGILIVQHISQGFVDGLVEWLKSNCALDIKVGKAGEVLKSGTVIIAPDDYNLVIDEEDVIGLREDVSKRMLHVPSIDHMMKSVAESYGKEAVGVIMTGMGSDGVEGIKAIKKCGGITIAQDEKTSVIFGMNKVAIQSGCIDKVLALDKIADELVELI